MSKKIILFKSIVLSFTLLTNTCSAQALSSNDLKGKWFDPHKSNSTSFLNFLDDTTLIINAEKKKSVSYYKLDSSKSEERIIIRLKTEDTVHIVHYFIRRINNEKIALQNYTNLRTEKWKPESIYNTLYFVKQKENK